jgi:hypothetical protein
MLNRKLPANDLRDYQDVALSGGFLTSPVLSASLFQSQFSPDGQWMVFEATTDTPTGIDSFLFVTSTAGEPRIPVGQGKHWDDKPRWSSDGKTIYSLSLSLSLSGRSGFFDVWGMHFDPVNGTTVGKPFQVTAFDKPSLMISPRIEGAELSVTRDRMALLMEETSGSIWMLDHIDQ